MKMRCIAAFMLILFLVSGCTTVQPDAQIPVCPVHKIQMKDDVVPINYGLIRIPKYYLDAREALFPNSTRVVLGGCIVGTNSPQEKVVFFCPECRKAQVAFDNAIMWHEAELEEKYGIPTKPSTATE